MAHVAEAVETVEAPGAVATAVAVAEVAAEEAEAEAAAAVAQTTRRTPGSPTANNDRSESADCTMCGRTVSLAAAAESPPVYPGNAHPRRVGGQSRGFGAVVTATVHMVMAGVAERQALEAVRVAVGAAAEVAAAAVASGHSRHDVHR